MELDGNSFSYTMSSLDSAALASHNLALRHISRIKHNFYNLLFFPCLVCVACRASVKLDSRECFAFLYAPHLAENTSSACKLYPLSSRATLVSGQTLIGNGICLAY